MVVQVSTCLGELLRARPAMAGRLNGTMRRSNHRLILSMATQEPGLHSICKARMSPWPGGNGTSDLETVPNRENNV